MKEGNQGMKPGWKETKSNESFGEMAKNHQLR